MIRPKVGITPVNEATGAITESCDGVAPKFNTLEAENIPPKVSTTPINIPSSSKPIFDKSPFYILHNAASSCS